jgi:hypothetical protein
MLEPKESAAAAAAVAAAAAITSGASAAAAAALAANAECDGRFPRRDVRRRVTTASAAPPTLSIVAVRWCGERTEFCDQWGAISSSVSDKYVEAMLGEAYATFGPAYEVLSVFVQSGADLDRLQPMIGSLTHRLRGAHRCAMYFLWPTMAQDGGQQQGMVPAASVFGAMRGAEAAGLPTRFPHPSQLYAVLLSKEWQAQSCLSRQ